MRQIAGVPKKYRGGPASMCAACLLLWAVLGGCRSSRPEAASPAAEEAFLDTLLSVQGGATHTEEARSSLAAKRPAAPFSLPQIEAIATTYEALGTLDTAASGAPALPWPDRTANSAGAVRRMPDLQPQQAATPAFATRYAAALALFNTYQYEQARTAFAGLLAEDSTHGLSDNCWYWIGECYAALQSTPQAIKAFQKALTFPNSNKIEDALIRLGMLYFKQGARAAAQAQFERLLSGNSPRIRADLAKRYLDKLSGAASLR